MYYSQITPKNIKISDFVGIVIHFTSHKIGHNTKNIKVNKIRHLQGIQKTESAAY